MVAKSEIEQKLQLETGETLLYEDSFQLCSAGEGHADLVLKAHNEVVETIASGSSTGNRTRFCNHGHHVVINFTFGKIEQPFFVVDHVPFVR